jgi:hypothetical protein
MAVIVTGVFTETRRVETENVALIAPAGTVTLDGAVAMVVLLFCNLMITPPLGARLLKLIRPVAALPPTTLVGLKVTDDTDKAASNAL